MIELGLVQPFEDGTLLGVCRLVAGQFVKVERVQLELYGVADGLEAHRIAQLAILDQLQLTAAKEALSVRNGETARQFETALATPGVADLRAADFILFDNAAAFRTRGRHLISLLRRPTRPLASARPYIRAFRVRRGGRPPWRGSR